MRVLKLLGCAAALALLVAPGARADEWTKETILTFSAPIELPGIALPAGTYHFKLADPGSQRRVVEVIDKDQMRVYGLFLTIPNDRLEPPDKPLVMFREVPAGSPAAVKAWFYPGDRTGYEFVYPREQAMKLAKANREPVLSMAEESTTEATQTPQGLAGAKIGRVDETGRLSSDQPEIAKAGEPQPAPVATSGAEYPTPTGTSGSVSQQPATTPSAESNISEYAQPTERRSRRLPRTASPLALMELLSGLSIGGALGLRRARRTRS